MNDEIANNVIAEDDKNIINIIYILYLVSIIVGLTGLIGVIMAYVYRGNAGPVAASHYTWQIRTFWIALAVGIVSALTLVIGIGFLIALALLVWLVVRCVKGLQWNNRGEAVPDPTDWLFG